MGFPIILSHDCHEETSEVIALSRRIPAACSSPNAYGSARQKDKKNGEEEAQREVCVVEALVPEKTQVGPV